MGFFSGLADFIDYMMFGEDSNSAARSREQRAEYERKAQERYEREQQSKRRHIVGQVALKAINRAKKAQAQKGRDLQYVDADCKVEVRNGFDSRSNRFTTDIVVYDRSRSDGGHVHIVLDEDGNVITEHWKTNK